MKGIIVNYRGGLKTQTNNQMVIKIQDVKTRAQASKLLGKKVVWQTVTKKKIKGKISRVHGNNGAVIARFEPSLPGQSIGTEVEIVV